MKTKWISALLMFCMLLSTIPFSTSATTETADAYVPMQNYSAEIAAVTTDWSINDAEDWRKAVEISEGEAGLTFEGQTLHLTADIDMANQAVDPLCYGNSFNGMLDGHGYVFKNFKMKITSNAGCYVGLIGTVGGTGVVKNLGIEDGAITFIYSGTVTSVGIGAIAGRMTTGGQILRCWNGADVTAVITGSEDDVSVGGIVGRGLRGSVVDGCYNIGAVSGALHAAGINDWMQTYDAKNSSGLIKNCFNAGSLSADYVGVGRLPKTSSSNSFMNTYSIGSNVAFSALTEVGQDTAAVLNAVNTAETSNLKKVEYTSGKLAWKLNSNFIGDGEQTFYTVQNQKTIFGDVTNQTVKLNFVHDGETVAEAYMNADSARCLDELQDSYLEAEYNVGEEATLENGNVLSLQAIPANKTLTVEIISGTRNEFVEENFWQYTVEEDGITLVQYLGTATDVYIPSVLEHEGTKYPVVKLGVGLFQDNINLKSVTFGDGILELGDKAFSGCTGLTSITIPDSVTIIKDYAFKGCTGLTSITIPDSVTGIGFKAFYNCGYYNNDDNWENGALYIGKHLIEVKTTISGAYTIKDGSLTIGAYAFSNCDGLTSVTIPDSVISIMRYAFRGCTGLTSIIIPDSVTGMGTGAFLGCTGVTEMTLPFVGAMLEGTSYTHFGYIFGASNGSSVPDSLKKVTITKADRIESDAFEGCTELTRVTLLDSVISIGDSAFSGCTGLTSIAIPDSVTSIGAFAFYGCTGLTSIAIPDSITSIRAYAFKGCTGLTSITIPDSVTSIGSSAFSGCTGVTSVNIPDSVTSIGSSAFSGCTGLTSITIPDSVTIIKDYAFEGCTGLTSITIPDSVTTIGEDAFYGCTGLTSITIPDSVTSIGKSAFFNCDGLTSITIPDSVTNIKVSAFGNCDGLTSITIPKSVTSIGHYAFAYCDNLTSVTIPYTVTSIGTGVFSDSPVTLKVHEDTAGHAYALEYDYTISKLIEHTPASADAIIPASCTKEGARTNRCSVCGLEYTKPIPMTAHTPDFDLEGNLLCSVCGTSQVGDGRYTIDKVSYLIKDGKLVDGEIADWGEEKDFFIVGGRPAPAGVYNYDGKTLYITAGYKLANGVTIVSDSVFAEGLCVEVGKAYLFEEGCLVDGKTAAWSDGEEYLIVKGRPVMGGAVEIDGKTVYLLSDGSYADGVWQMTNEDICAKLGITAGLNYLFEEGCLVDGKAAAWSDGEEYFIVKGRPVMGGTVEIDGKIVYLLSDGSYANGVWHVTDEDICTKLGITAGLNYLFEEGVLVREKEAVWNNDNSYFIVDGRPFNRGVAMVDGQPTYILNYKKVNGVWSLKGEEGKAVAEAFGIQPEKAYLFEEGKLVDGKNAAWANGQTYYIVKGRPF